MAEQRDIVRDMSDIAHAVRERRSELRLRFEDVAEMAGDSRHLVSAVEKGDSGDQVEKLLRILDALQIRVDIRRGPARHVVPPAAPARPARTRQEPAVDPERMHDDPERIACLDCGARVRDLPRHVRQQHGLGIAGYRQRWSIPEEVPLVPRSNAGPGGSR